MKKSEIRISVNLNEDKFPETIRWSADDSGVEGDKECASALLALWDAKEGCSLRIDLWTSKMMVGEMQRFFYESFRSMADTYARATNDAKAAEEITAFAEKFGKMTGVTK